MLYVYALVIDVANVADLAGIFGEPLQLLAVDDAHVVVGETGALPAIDAVTVRAQDSVVRKLHERAGALLPMRFGTSAAGAAEVVGAVHAAESVMQRLQAVRGREQMTVRVAGRWSNAVPSLPSGSGRAYLEARAKARASAPELTALAHAAGELQRDVRIEPASQPGLLGSVYHLIDRGRADEYRDVMQRAAATLGDIRVIITGPSPAYAFA